MFLSKAQIERSLQKLESVHPFYGITFLVCKAAQLPVGKTIEYLIEQAEEEFLKKYYQPDHKTAWYYRVFRTSNKNIYWLHPKYPTSGSQAMRTRTFASAFIHRKNTNIWGWDENYVQTLKSLLYKNKVIPIFDLACWLYREYSWRPDTTSEDIIATFIAEFHINPVEQEQLFDISIPPDDLYSIFQDTAVSWNELWNEIIGQLPPGISPDIPPDKEGTLSLLELRGIGPAHMLHVKFADRVNLFTGDNGLGKTFILECAWWALTGTWSSSPAYPRDDANKNEPQIKFEISGTSRRPEPSIARYDWKLQNWIPQTNRQTISALSIYARVDGAFAVWDPAKINITTSSTQQSGPLFFSREDVWQGLWDTVGGKINYLSNGLISDWINWQNSPDQSHFETLKKVLHRLSPPGLDRSDLGLLEPGKPTRIPGDSRWIPTIKHPYGEVPLVYASAGVKRIVALAYLIVWTWEEHKSQSNLIRENPQRRMVILADEIEAHLHPQWQRQILPALLDIQEDLEADLQIQFLITTHAPLVMASMEPRFDVDHDKIFHLNLLREGLFDGEVRLEEPEFTRHGSVDAWLTSDNIFEMKYATNLPVEQVIEDAKKLQMQESITEDQIREMSIQLMKLLGPHDPFWRRWLFFAEQHGVEL